MKTLVRVAVLIFGAAGFCIGLGLAASADVGSPASAYQSAIKIALTERAVEAAAKPAAAAPAEKKPEPAKSEAPVKRDEPVVTPVPEQFVMQAPAPVAAPKRSTRHRSVVAALVFGAGAKYRQIEAFFGQVASAARDSSGSGTGVPVLVLGLLSAAAVFAHHRRYGRWATDENAVDLLYARELTPPG